MTVYSQEAQELAFAWEQTQTPIDAIAEEHLAMVKKIRELEAILKQHQEKFDEDASYHGWRPKQHTLEK